MLYLWLLPETYSEKLVASYQDDESINRYLLSKGMALSPDEIGSIVFEAEVSTEELSTFDCIINHSTAPLVSEKVMDILKEMAADEVQFIDAQVRCTNGILTTHKMLIATNMVKGIDHNESVAKTLPGIDAIIGFDSIEYNHGCLGKLNLAREGEYAEFLLVSYKVKNAFGKANISGVRFLTPEDYY